MLTGRGRDIFCPCFQISVFITKSQATHRVTKKPGLNEVNEFVGYMDFNYGQSSEEVSERKYNVKKFISDKKRENKQRRRREENNMEMRIAQYYDSSQQ